MSDRVIEFAAQRVGASTVVRRIRCAPECRDGKHVPGCRNAKASANRAGGQK